MDRFEYITHAYNTLRSRGLVHTKKDFAALLGVGQPQISKALAGDERNLTKPLIDKVQQLMDKGISAVPQEWVQEFPALDGSPVAEKADTLPVIPTEAIAGTLGDFAESVASYDCERMVSPVKGADYAMKVCGESMSPEFPNGCLILIKRINENAFIEWGKVYVLDTENGAVIKKIRRTDRDDVVECVSINEDFQSFTIDTKFIRGWYRVLMVLSLK